MLKVPAAGQNHRQAPLVAGGDYLLIAAAPYAKQAVNKARVETGGGGSLPWRTLMYAGEPAHGSRKSE